MSHLTGDIYAFKNLYLIEKKYSHRRNNFPAGNIENSYRQYISFGRKVFPLGILSKQVVIKKKKTSYRILKSDCSFVQIPSEFKFF